MREFGRYHCMNAHKIERVIPTKTDIAFEFISFILVLRNVQFSSVYLCIPTKHKILYQEYRDRKRRP